MKEVWKALPGFEELYEVSNIGRVKGLKRRVIQRNGRRMTYPELIKKQHTDRDGYKYVSITGNGVNTKKGVHRLVAKTFIPNPRGYPQVNHTDGNKENNLVTNLEWCTPSMNTHHAYKNGLASNVGENNSRAKLTWEKVAKIRRLYKTGNYMYKDLGGKFGVSGEQISLIVNYKAWKEDITDERHNDIQRN